MRKEVTVILNHCFAASTTYRDSLHWLQALRGTGIATPEANLLQQVTAMRETFLRAILLHLHNSYNALESFRCLDILVGYVAGTRSL